MSSKMTPLLAATVLSMSWAIGSPVAANFGSSMEAGTAAASFVTRVHGETPTASGQETGQTLYERVGGIFAIAAVVDRFSDAIIDNPKLNRNPALVEWNQEESDARLPGLKVMRTIWIASMTGGPFDYTGLPLPVAHEKFSLTEEECDEVGAEIVRALDHFDVPEREKQELVDAYMKSKPLVVSGSSGAEPDTPSE